MRTAPLVLTHHYKYRLLSCGPCSFHPDVVVMGRKGWWTLIAVSGLFGSTFAWLAGVSRDHFSTVAAATGSAHQSSSRALTCCPSTLGVSCSTSMCSNLGNMLCIIMEHNAETAGCERTSKWRHFANAPIPLLHVYTFCMSFVLKQIPPLSRYMMIVAGFTSV